MLDCVAGVLEGIVEVDGVQAAGDVVCDEFERRHGADGGGGGGG